MTANRQRLHLWYMDILLAYSLAAHGHFHCAGCTNQQYKVSAAAGLMPEGARLQQSLYRLICDLDFLFFTH